MKLNWDKMLRLVLQLFVIAYGLSHFVFFLLDPVSQKVFVSQNHFWENLKQQKYYEASATDISMCTTYN